jgi:GDP-L-fucose synthase
MLPDKTSDFWKRSRVLVTGGAGFLGTAVVQKLRQRGCANISVPRSQDFDLCKAEDIVRLLEQSRLTLIIHLAAVVGGIGANQDNPARFFYQNAMMGIQLIDIAARCGIEKLVCIGTVCSYPKFTPVPFREQNIWDGYPEETNAPYGLAKKMLLVQCQAYRQQYGFNAIYLIPVNLYGPGDNVDLETSHVIPALIRKCEDAKARGEREIVCWGTGNASREFLYVDDAAEGILLAAEHYDKPEPVNLGSGEEVTICDLAHLIRELTEFRGDIVWDSSRPDGQPRRCLDTTRAEREFGFRARTRLRDGLLHTINCYGTTRNKEQYCGQSIGALPY